MQEKAKVADQWCSDRKVLNPRGQGAGVEKAKGSRLGHLGSHALLCVFSRKSNTLPINNIHDWTCDHRHG